MADIIVTVNEPVTEITATDDTTVEIAVTEQVIDVTVGTSGPQGPPGPPVTPEQLAYVHTQSTSSAVWVITHDLGFHPNVTVIDSAGTQVEGSIAYDSLNQVTMTFTGAFAGVAYCS